MALESKHIESILDQELDASSKELVCSECGTSIPWANELISLREQVITDPLTGLYNVRHFRSALAVELERTVRTGSPTSLMMIDLDHFKQVNDQWGHEVGNQVLRLTAKLIKEVTRQLDIQCRYGGEEFVVILPATNILLASQVAERLRKRIQDSKISVGEESIEVTTSIGLAVQLAGDYGSAAQLIKAADECLYEAKQMGRNRVCFVNDAVEQEMMVSHDEKAALMGMFSDLDDED